MINSENLADPCSGSVPALPVTVPFARAISSEWVTYIDPLSDTPGVTMIVVQVNEVPAISNRIACNDLVIHTSTLENNTKKPCPDQWITLT